MKVLLLTNMPHLLADTVKAEGDDYAVTMDAPEWWTEAPDFLVSFGYRYILKPNVLDQYRGRAINIHISLLPWNRGADPNFWSWFDRTPKGVSIHEIDKGIDTGDVLAQLMVNDWGRCETLRTSRSKLVTKGAFLFSLHWKKIREGKMLNPWGHASGAGSYHRSTDMLPYKGKLSRGWDTPVTEVEELGSSSRNN